MKALSIAQPWAELIASGKKTVETRSWQTSYRGPIAIHAARGLTKESLRLYNKMKRDLPPTEELARGAVIAVGELVGCVPTVTEIDGKRFLATDHIPAQEIPWGDFSPGRFAWQIQNVERIRPVLVRGRLGLWEWDGALARS